MRRHVALVALAAGALAATLAAPAAAGPVQPRFTTVRLAGSSGSAEPRVAVGPHDIRYIDTNGIAGRPNRRPEVVYRSSDGVRWATTPAQPPSQNVATTDVDIVTTRTGRVIAQELDDAGISFRTDYSDDGGRTWTPSIGTSYADTDRNWLAVGPDDPTTHQPRVYLLFHNLLSGLLTHNMFVATSTDGGATFGPPVPVSVPGQQDWADLQCADSGGPSNIVADQHTGRVYVVFGTRSSNSPLSGCTAQPVEVNVVAANRVWVVSAEAKDTQTPGAWTPHLAVDDTGPPAHITGMQLAPGMVDTAGNVYVAYPESPNDYPNYDGASIKLVHASPDALDRWSAPSTVAAGGGPGNVLPNLVVGLPGRVAVSYFHGVAQRGAAPTWRSYVSISTDALSASPHWVPVQLSPVAVEAPATASTLMGACFQGQQATLNGFACGRSTDVNGIAMDSCGRVLVTWPAQAGLATDATYAAQQMAGPTLLDCRTAVTKHPRRAKATRHRRLPRTGLVLAAPVGLLVAGLARRRRGRR